MGKDLENMFPFLTSALNTRNRERVTDLDTVAFTYRAIEA